jgi:CrcB protein
MLNPAVIKTYLVVAIGGAIGSVARFWLGDLGSTLVNGTFPWGILMVNLIGCFVIGFFSEATGSSGMLKVGPNTRTFVIVGICGGFTTFSSFSLGTLSLLQRGDLFLPIANVVASVIGCLIAVAAGGGLVRFTNISAENLENGRI